jgi:hypothetical protein
MHDQRLVSVVKMATVLEGRTIEKQRSVLIFLWTKGLSAKDIHNEMLPAYGGKCLSRKAIRKWVEKRGKRFADDEEVVKDLSAAGFDALAKRWDKCVNVGGGYVEK